MNVLRFSQFLHSSEEVQHLSISFRNLYLYFTRGSVKVRFMVEIPYMINR